MIQYIGVLIPHNAITKSASRKRIDLDGYGSSYILVRRHSLYDLFNNKKYLKIILNSIENHPDK